MKMASEPDEMQSEYKFDYAKAKPNRFAAKYTQMQRTVVLDDDIAESFPSSESVNEALRFLIRIARENQTEFRVK